MAEFLQTQVGTGFVYGVFAMLVLSLFLFWFNIWLKSLKSFFKPQAVVMTTKKSPFDVMIQAILQTILFTAATLLIASVLYIYYFL